MKNILLARSVVRLTPLMIESSLIGGEAMFAQHRLANNLTTVNVRRCSTASTNGQGIRTENRG
jgi:hypothetical protein